MRAFKYRSTLELWIKTGNEKSFKKQKEYKFCAFSGDLGPKLKEGDRQIPEGIYHINRFNPNSKFHLSLGLNYPNKSDLKFANKNKPGGDIFIHGGCVTVGCIAINNFYIEDLYGIAEKAKKQGQKQIRVDIFPANFKLTDSEFLIEIYPHSIQFLNFWKNLETIFYNFEKDKILREVGVDEQGRYLINDRFYPLVLRR